MSLRTVVRGLTLALVSGVASITLGGCGAPATTTRDGRAEARGPNAGAALGAVVGKPAPPFTRLALTGGSVAIPTNRQATVVFFFATWSLPDMNLVGRMQLLALMHPELAIVAVGIDDEGDRLVEATRTRGARYPVIWDAGHVLASAYRLDTDPTALVLDKDGVVRFVHRGFHDGEEYAIDDEVSALLKKDVCGRSLVTDDAPSCFHQCDRMEAEEAKCGTPECKARCGASSRTCRETCARDNRPRNSALAVCRRERPPTREACLAACHTEEMGHAIDTCEWQSAGRKALLDECTATCGVAACRASCQRSKR